MPMLIFYQAGGEVHGSPGGAVVTGPIGHLPLLGVGRSFILFISAKLLNLLGLGSNL